MIAGSDSSGEATRECKSKSARDAILAKLRSRTRVRTGDHLKPVAEWEAAFYDDYPMSAVFSDSLDPRTRLIYDMCVIDRTIVRYNSSLYVFVPHSMSWHYARGQVASRYLCDLLGMDGVTVNFAVATSPFLDYADHIATLITHVTSSVCLSSWRMSVRMQASDSSLIFERMTGIVPMPAEAKWSQRESSLCVCPVSTRVLPGVWRRSGQTLVQKVLSNVIRPESMLPLMWVIGNGLLDPVREPRIVYFYGSGGDGKSTTINVLRTVLEGAITSFTKDYVMSDREVSVEDLSRAASSRFVSYGDVNLRYGTPNTKLWKMITGGDAISSPIGEIRLTCTALFASNDLWHDNKRIQEKWFTRRTLVVKMEPLAPDSDPPPDLIPDEDRSRFIADCIHIRASHEFLPVSAQDILITILGRSAERATRAILLEDCNDFHDARAATVAVAMAALMKLDLFLSLVESITRSAIWVGPTGSKAMRGIKLRENYDDIEQNKYFLVLKGPDCTRSYEFDLKGEPKIKGLNLNDEAVQDLLFRARDEAEYELQDETEAQSEPE